MIKAACNDNGNENVMTNVISVISNNVVMAINGSISMS